jgi:hypothetical protein
MTREQFDALLERRDELQAAHERACEILAEEDTRYARENHRECARRYDALLAVQEQIDAEIAAERAEEQRAGAASDHPPTA